MSFSPPGMVMLVDDDPVVRDATRQSFELAGVQVNAFASAAEALLTIDAGFNGVIVSDIRMPEIDGLQFFQRVQAIDPTIPFILITGHGDIPMAVAALQTGVDDFLPKPFASAHLIASAKRGVARRQLELDNRLLRAMVEAADQTRSLLVGETAVMSRLRETIGQVAPADADVLVEGEAGVGKSLVALMLHQAGKRRGQPFVSFLGRETPPDAIERQLFGDAGLSRGTSPYMGKIAQAHRGTLYIDDLDCLSIMTQQRLVSVIEDREFTPAGAERPTFVDVRVIAGSRPAPGNAAICEDLRHALDVVKLRVPALRERRDDIPLLFAHFRLEAATQARRPPAPITESVRRHLVDHDWPGNVRELKSFAYRSIVGVDQADRDPPEMPVTLPERVDRFEAMAISAVLRETRGNAAEAVRRLGIPRKTFYDKLKRHGIAIDRFRS